MALPASLLQHVDQHACFTGCYGGDANVSACLDPGKPLESLAVVTCQDCLARVGVPLSLLPTGTTGHSLATVLTNHLRQQRGFALAFSGYHTRGPGFWLSATYYDCGLFLINGERSRQRGSDLDLLLLAFQHGVIPPPDPRMNDRKHYTVQTVHVNFSKFQPRILNKQGLLAAPQCRTQTTAGWQKVTLAEFLPVTTQPSAANGNGGAPAKPLKVGDICPACGAEYRVRPLLNGSFVGCLC
jgi:hypothetical protein